jgi:hypothetical protein
MIKQIRDDSPKGSYSLAQAMIGDCGSCVSLAATAGSGKYQPAFRMIGEGPDLFTARLELSLPLGITIKAFGLQVIESEPGKWPQIAVTFQSFYSAFVEFPQHADAGKRLPKIRVIRRYVKGHHTTIMANRALLGFHFSLFW